MKTFILLAAIAAAAMSLTCYRRPSWMNRYQSFLEDAEYCTSIYHYKDEYGIFTGGDDFANARVFTQWNPSENKDCQLIPIKSRVATEVYGMWVCYCFTHLCNVKYTWKEFQERGYTIAEKGNA